MFRLLQSIVRYEKYLAYGVPVPGLVTRNYCYAILIYLLCIMLRGFLIAVLRDPYLRALGCSID